MRRPEDCETCETCIHCVEDLSKQSTGVVHGKCVRRIVVNVATNNRKGFYPEVTSMTPACSEYEGEYIGEAP